MIVEDASRFARELMAQELGIVLLGRRGVRLLTASGDDLTASDDPSRKMMRQIAGSFAEYEKARLVSVRVQVSLTPLPVPLPRTPTCGVGEAPRHEVAGGGAPSVQRALWRFDLSAGVDGGRAAARNVDANTISARVRA